MYTTLSEPFANFATTVTELVPDVPAKVPLAPGLVPSVPLFSPFTETVSAVTSPAMQVLAMTSRWIEEGCTFCPLTAMVQDGGWGAVGATKSVDEMEAGAGILIGCNEGFRRKTPAMMITRMIIPPMMIQGRRDLFAIR